MASQVRPMWPTTGRSIHVAGSAVIMLASICLLASPALTQTFTILHTFTAGADGATPFSGLTVDRGGNLYGTTSAGGFKGNDCRDVAPFSR